MAVAFLATGEELIESHLQDTNSFILAQQLLEHAILPGQRVMVGDREQDITAAILYLLEQHQALITIGGLGPTADDRTRYALAEALHLPLIFYEQAWDWVVERLTRKGLSIPETNRQQALLPQGAQVIHNPNGTAAACYLSWQGKDIFMLPGPPNEILPIFESSVLPKLKERGYASVKYRRSWLLLGVSEGAIAQKLEEQMGNSPCYLGYRVHYPYLEIKLSGEDQEALTNLSQRFEQILAPHTVSHNRETASAQLIKYICASSVMLTIQDYATYGRLESVLYTPDTQDKLNFQRHERRSPSFGMTSSEKKFDIIIEGLKLYWEKPNAEREHTTILLKISGPNVVTVERTIPIRGDATLYYAIELIAWEILLLLTQT